eukprot:2337411-Pyramimonas_sp.AAC.1
MCQVLQLPFWGSRSSEALRSATRGVSKKVYMDGRQGEDVRYDATVSSLSLLSPRSLQPHPSST